MKNSSKSLTTMVVAVMAVVSVGVFVSSALGYDFIRMISLVTTPDATVSENEAKPDCEQSSTTTPCSELEELPEETASQDQRQSEPKPISYGPLTKSYSDSEYGFSIKYPNDFEIQSGDGVTFLDKNNARNFAMNICTPGTFCGRFYRQADISSLDDFKQTLTFENGEVHIPVEYSEFITSSGIKVLKRVFDPKYYDSEGRDITEKKCEECQRTTNFVIFKNDGSFIIFKPVYDQIDFTETVVKSFVWEN